MPQNLPSRAWGTRFDTLLASPPLSPTNHTNSSQREVGTGVEPDFVPDSISRGPHEKVVHDASIFVGSLPPNIDHLELTRMLSGHLVGHPEVQTIKVIRDTKGGTCAFIQCQDATSAAHLIRNLHALPPRPFLGRYLRYEPARAFRTLLISYRIPRQFIPSGVPDGTSDFGRDGVELELPTTMRIWRQPGVRHISLLYNSDARTAAEDETLEPQDEPGANGSGLHLHPLVCDEETLSKISEFFGPVEHLRPYRRSGSELSASLAQIFPPPHDAPRSEKMDGGCWEVKWRHRDDCVNALMTLRRVPHLTVTWAHQPGPSETNPNRHGLLQRSANLHLVGGRSFSSHVQGALDDSADVIVRSTPSRLPSSAFPSRFSGKDHSTNPNIVAESVPSAFFNASSEMTDQPSFDAECTPRGSFVAGAKNGPRPRPRALSLNHGQTTHPRPAPIPGWSKKCLSTAGDSNKETESRLWSDRMASNEDHDGMASLPSPSASMSKYGTTRAHLAQSIAPGTELTSTYDDEVQEVDVDIPPTPDFGRWSITPRTPGSLILRTPTTGSYMGDFHNSSAGEFESKTGYPNEGKSGGNALDPTTIFVGGLEKDGPNAWDEDRVRSLFSKYGGVENVKVIRPVNKHSAFAFVKFNNTDSPVRAVQEEHNRLFGRRPIRVQLRDCNPPHRTARRGRGWYPNVGIVHMDSGRPYDQNDDLRVDASLQKPVVISIEGGSREASIVNENVENAIPLLQGLSVKDDADAEANLSKPPADLPETPAMPRAEANTAPKELASQVPLLPETSWPGDSSPSVPITPSPSYTSTSSVSTPGVAYPAPALGYYHPQGWMPGFAQQFPYPVPFMGGYPGYPLHSQPAGQAYTHATGSDASGTPSGTPAPFAPPGMYAPFIPYPAYPMKPPNYDPAQAQQQGPASNAPTPQQAPLLPTGFIQGTGMLVAVYPPDALNQYMSGHQDQQTAATPGAAVVTPQGPTPAAWRPFPHASPGYPPVATMPSATGLQQQPYPHGGGTPGGSHGWTPNVSPAGPGSQGPYFPGAHARQLFPSTSNSGTAGFGNGPTFEQRNIPPRRQYRRDNQSNYHKHNNSRGHSHQRYPRGGFTPSNSSSSVQHSASPAPYMGPHQLDPAVEAGWNQ
ncbi:hypothetical protein BV22DRAFT_1028340 [Leucogyrophana mollusca]|uniref:Uncharacterized protein n=1 Tax=Leucogyrophana mollusca TaxID=85980 RepID=A0ACB8BYY8_9AGAM|nr:hypothetical protein BV22DRAFT_1028340 [Leucogyrophana mollusca]